jgi:hypothetical protein
MRQIHEQIPPFEQRLNIETRGVSLAFGQEKLKRKGIKEKNQGRKTSFLLFILKPTKMLSSLAIPKGMQIIIEIHIKNGWRLPVVYARFCLRTFGKLRGLHRLLHSLLF